MGEDSKIEWCRHTWNPWFGCTEVGPACDFCYARVMMAERYGRVTWGAGEDRVRTSAANWREPFKWNRAAAAAGEVATVFCLSLGDIWDNEVEPKWRHDAFAVMEATPNLLYLLLSKRIGNAIKMCDPLAGNSILPKNAALGATMINQEEWDRDMPKLKEAGERLGARFTFASVEPMLGPIDAHGHLPDWVICGGESGTHARPMHPRWARSLRDQCEAANVAFHFKQWGEWAPDVADQEPDLVMEGRARAAILKNDRWHFEESGYAVDLEYASGCGDWLFRLGKKRAGRKIDGTEHNGFPGQS
jgi:protein gp37